MGGRVLAALMACALMPPGTFVGAAGAPRQMQVAVVETAPLIDGDIDADEWRGAELAEGFVQIEPEFGAVSSFRTVVRVVQTEVALYVAFDAFDPEPTRMAAAVTTRDGDLDDDDSVAVALDTFDDDRTAYLFRTNALATQQDGRLADNGRTVDLRWDAAWRCAARRSAEGWTAELEIPFAVLKYDPGSERTWGVNFIRTVPRRLETATWSGPAESQWRVSGFGELGGLELPRRDVRRWQLIPYGLATSQEGEGADFQVGGDGRFRPSSTLGLDLTLNPDFALVEADVETINLSRFELFIPEKRPFFLEGGEMFSQRIRQFYSRRIGDISWGAKLSGKVGKTDVAVLASSEDRDAGAGAERATYGVTRVQYSLFGGSNVGLLAASRRLAGEQAGSVGLDATLFFTETLGLTAQLLSVHGPTADGGLAWFVRPAYDSATTHFHVRYTNLDPGIREDFNAVGYLQDDDRKELDSNLSRTWFTNGVVEKVEGSVNYNRYWSHEGVLRSWELEADVDVVLRSGWELEIERSDEYELFEKGFRNEQTTLAFGWDGRNGRSASVFAGTGRNYDSDLLLWGAEAEWAFGDRLRLSYSLTRLELQPDPEEDTTWIHVLVGRYNFSPDLFLKVLFQTNSVIDKENVQLLGVWRFLPPFGSLQVAYQRGTSRLGEASRQGNTFFSKLAWVF